MTCTLIVGIAHDAHGQFLGTRGCVTYRLSKRRWWRGKEEEGDLCDILLVVDSAGGSPPWNKIWEATQQAPVFQANRLTTLIPTPWCWHTNICPTWQPPKKKTVGNEGKYTSSLEHMKSSFKLRYHLFWEWRRVKLHIYIYDIAHICRYTNMIKYVYSQMRSVTRKAELIAHSHQVSVGIFRVCRKIRSSRRFLLRSLFTYQWPGWFSWRVLVEYSLLSSRVDVPDSKQTNVFWVPVVNLVVQ